MTRGRVLLRLAPPVLALLVLAAHFLRAGEYIVVALLVALIALLAVPRWWAARLVQLVLVLGTIEWIMTLAELAFERMVQGEPAARLIAILGTVAVLTAASALVFRTAPLRRYYGLGRHAASTDDHRAR